MTDVTRALYSAAQLRELDRRAIHEHGIAGYTLMQRAAAACWREIVARWPEAKRIDVVCGQGNNGGDGYEIARLALAAGREVQVHAIGLAPAAGDAATARAAWLHAGGTLAPATAPLAGDVIVDALLGIGIAREVTGEMRAAIDAIDRARARGARVLAVDLPSGLDATSGRVWGAAVSADVTVSFIGAKPGLVTGAGAEHAGEVLLDTLAIPAAAYAELEPFARALQPIDLAAWLPRRARTAHKGAHGHVLVVGGDTGMAGAALLAARAALRAGAGLVSVATRSAHAATLGAAQAEIMSHGVDNPAALGPLLERCSVVAIGPGLGQSEWGQQLLARVLETTLPVVIDADALNLLAAEPAQRAQWVLTPHPGEAARLLGCSSSDIQNDRPQAAQRLRARYGGTVVLKGAGTLVQGERLAICSYGNPGMAAGGMGDVLTGVIAALIAQGLAPERAAQAGVLTHALAGDVAARAGERGLLPGDLIDVLRAVLNP